MKYIKLNTVAALSLFAMNANAVDVSTHGKVFVEYGQGAQRYGDGGNDRLGASLAAIGVEAKKNNTKAVLWVTGQNLATTDSTVNTNKGLIGISEAFLDFSKIAKTDFSVSAGYQSLMFGLKPGNFAGDRTIQGSVEFGGLGGMATSKQEAPAVILSYEIQKGMTLRGGAFDNLTDTIIKNYFVDYRGNYDAVYVYAGFETIDVANNARILWDAGIGMSFMDDMMDLSFEYVNLAKAINGTKKNDQYYIGEYTFKFTNSTSLILDYGRAAAGKDTTYRGGLSHVFNDAMTASLEYSYDDFNASADVHSVDARLAFNF